jgi:Mce-associated membrane protein
MSPTRAGVRVVGSGADEEGGDGEDVPVVPGTPGGGRPSPVMLALAVLALAGLFGTVFFWSRYHTLADRNSQQKAVVKTSTDFLVALFNFQASTVDADFARVESFATGDFRSQLAQFLSTDIRKALAEKQAVSRGQIRALYVQSLAGNEAVVYADVDQTIANLSFRAPEQDEVRLVLNLSKTSAGWRISDVTVEQAPPIPTAQTTTTTAKP